MKNKPLTIEEVKALPEGEWVWISEPKTFFGDLSSYYTKSKASNDESFAYDLPKEDAYDPQETLTWEYSEYGKTWVVYRNKQEADGTAIPLPFPRQDAAFHVIKLKRRGSVSRYPIAKSEYYTKRMVTWKGLVEILMNKGDDGLWFKTAEEADAKVEELNQQLLGGDSV